MALSNLEGFYQPGTPKEAAKLLHRHGNDAMIIAGGTFIHGLVARGLVTDVQYLVSLDRLGLDAISINDKQAVFGASATFDAIENHPQVAASRLLAALVDAISYPPPQVKHAATIGGCVAASCPFLDLPIALLALDATAKVQGRHFKRKIPFEELFVSLFDSSLKRAEFITEISLPQQARPTASAFSKLETNANDLAIINAAVRISLDQGRCVAPRVFVGGGIGETPFRSREVEAALDGQSLTAELIADAAHAIRSNFEPLSDHRASSQYRIAMAEVFIGRSLLQAAQRLGVEVSNDA